MVWRRLSRYRPRFTRQLVIGPYIVDIACRSAKLALEFDGAQHQDTVVYDAVRTAFLKDRGWTVLRFWNGEVLSNLEGVLTVILNATAECLGGTHPQPLPSREGEGVGGEQSEPRDLASRRCQRLLRNRTHPGPSLKGRGVEI